MDIHRNEIDSEVIGGTVLELGNPAPDDDFAAIEHEYVARENPLYVVCKVPIEQLAAIHRLEALGFQFIETQLRLTFSLRKPFDVPASSPYCFERVANEDSLEQVLEIARTAFTDDRWLIDPLLANRGDLAGRRYAAYVSASYRRENEHVHRLVDTETGRALAFRTHRILGSGQALMLLGAVHPDYREAGIAPLVSFHEYNELLGDGITRITTHVSARNYAILNLEMSALKYRVVQSSVVLRKMYAP